MGVAKLSRSSMVNSPNNGTSYAEMLNSHAPHILTLSRALASYAEGARERRLLAVALSYLLWCARTLTCECANFRIRCPTPRISPLA